MATTIQIDEKLKARLDDLKIHPRETYNDLIIRLLGVSSPETVDRESLIETIEILSNPEMMAGIARGLRDVQEGRVKSFEQIRRGI
jgi:predicted transcriptional regulator